ncbi:helix-turn-helix domain-containing protein [Acidomonas methanolica]|uniref:helix-turn-helix domain-containing protein n=1 Tax=Acidomonas methanolica TaxID=437 RepID=UPI00211A17DA|nr:helix-turn-helix domain-containing protein [Acidomonas methanolica]MCQ9156954.1 helix-turn-helix domain-containing protein [Acidomonas methanolica]
MSGRPSLKAAFRRQVMDLFFDGMLKHSEKSVLMTLATFLGRGGLYPSHEAIAKACRYSVRTVIRALERAYELGIVERTHRVKRDGGRVVRTSNSYRLIVSAVDQVRAAGKHMARAVFQRVRHLSDRTAQKASGNISRTSERPLFGRRYPEPHGPTLSPSEWIEVINGWKSA